MRTQFTIFVLFLITMVGFAQTDSLVVIPVKDNSLYEDATGSKSNGAGSFLFVGTTNTGPLIRRAILKFDFLNSIPDGAIIDSAKLSMNVNKRNNATVRDINFYRLSKDWGEGASSGTGGGGNTQPGDATWIHTFSDTSFWDNPGGDFADTASFMLPVGDLGFYTKMAYPGDGLFNDLQLWMSEPSLNNGWIMIGDEEHTATAKRFASREHPTFDQRPTLTLYFQAVTAISENNVQQAESFYLHQNFPNPFNPTTRIAYFLEKSGPIELTVYNSIGQQIRNLDKGVRPAGLNTVVWNGKNELGVTVPTGTYFYRLTTTDGLQIKKMLLLK